MAFMSIEFWRCTRLHFPFRDARSCFRARILMARELYCGPASRMPASLSP